jgi:hypothetical protein
VTVTETQTSKGERKKTGLRREGRIGELTRKEEKRNNSYHSSNPAKSKQYDTNLVGRE